RRVVAGRPRGGRRRRAAAHPTGRARRPQDRPRHRGQRLPGDERAGNLRAGDIARWPDSYSGENLRIEHWVVAERQGQTAARNMLGQGQKFSEVPFFWSQHYDIPIVYVGHAETWDALDIDGDIKAHDAIARYRRAGRLMAVASIFRDLDSL